MAQEMEGNFSTQTRRFSKAPWCTWKQSSKRRGASYNTQKERIGKQIFWLKRWIKQWIIEVNLNLNFLMRISILSMVMKMDEQEFFWLVGLWLGLWGGYFMFLGWLAWFFVGGFVFFFLPWIPAEMIGIFLKKIVFFSWFHISVFLALVTNFSGRKK